MTCQNNVEYMWKVFKEKIQHGISTCIPLRKPFAGGPKDSWSRPLSHEIRMEIKAKRKLWKKYIRTKDKNSFNEI
jgi:hypothetical protein